MVSLPCNYLRPNPVRTPILDFVWSGLNLPMRKQSRAPRELTFWSISLFLRSSADKIVIDRGQNSDWLVIFPPYQPCNQFLTAYRYTAMSQTHDLLAEQKAMASPTTQLQLMPQSRMEAIAASIACHRHSREL
jgi:hypothetical protein